MDSELSDLLKELLVIIDELRVIDSPEIVRRLQLDDRARTSTPRGPIGPTLGEALSLEGKGPLGAGDSLLYSDDFVDTYEAIRRRMIELGELPPPPYDEVAQRGHHLPPYIG